MHPNTPSEPAQLERAQCDRFRCNNEADIECRVMAVESELGSQKSEQPERKLRREN